MPFQALRAITGPDGTLIYRGDVLPDDHPAVIKNPNSFCSVNAPVEVEFEFAIERPGPAPEPAEEPEDPEEEEEEEEPEDGLDHLDI